jgi:hypothetical protein
MTSVVQFTEAWDGSGNPLPSWTNQIMTDADCAANIAAVIASLPAGYTTDGISTFTETASGIKIALSSVDNSGGKYNFNAPAIPALVQSSVAQPSTPIRVLVGVGHSMMAGSIPGLYVPAGPLTSWQGLYGGSGQGFFTPNDPQGPQCDDGMGTILGRVADDLCAAGRSGNALTMTFAKSGALVGDFAPGTSNYAALENYIRGPIWFGPGSPNTAFFPSDILIHFGVNDAHAGTPQASFQASLSSLVTGLHAFISNAKIYVAVSANGLGRPGTTGQWRAADYVTAEKNKMAVRAAQAAVVDPPNNILAGPDLDTVILPEDTRDGVHWNQFGGAAKAAAAWASAMIP